MIHARVIVMKISNSKKELARIISENGGWRDGAKLAVFGPVSKKVRFSRHHEKPVTLHKSRGLGRGWEIVGQFDSWMESESIHVGKPFRNWHQTILSRAEYFHLYPVPDADGWIEWSGGECPVGEGDRIDVKFSDGDEHFDVSSEWDWGADAGSCNIIAYRHHKKQKSEPQYCESVTRSIPEPIAAPTTDQLLQDWRNADDYAKRKQAEADDAAAMRDERWNAVQARAGEMGVTVERKI